MKSDFGRIASEVDLSVVRAWLRARTSLEKHIRSSPAGRRLWRRPEGPRRANCGRDRAARPGREWPGACRLAALHQVGNYLRYTGRDASSFGKAARDPKQTRFDSKEKVAAAEPLQRDYLHWQICIDVQSPSFRKRSYFFNRLAWMRGRVYESDRIITETDNQFINHVLHSAAVWPNNADQYNSVLDALFNKGRKLRRLPRWCVEHYSLCILHRNRPLVIARGS